MLVGIGRPAAASQHSHGGHMRSQMRSMVVLAPAFLIAAIASPLAMAQSKWQNDAPGTVHRIDVAKLPAPFATESARQFPKVVGKPESAKLQALQVKQQLGVQALSIANQAPQTITSLFR